MSLDMIYEGLVNKAQKVDPIGSTLKFDFGDGFVYIDGTGGENVVSKENKDADCMIVMTPQDFNSLIKGDLNPMMAVMTGKVKIKGDMGVAMKMQNLL